ncbi:MAG: stage II sporulation protein R [Ruminococcaceae bacterium]|nr:stage II sporulation protein R [Oscillospiraceae bacterium]
MDGVFMKKFAKFVSTLLLVVVAFYLGSVSSDKRLLSENLIRLHVVADSNSAEDQAIKLQVRDAITAKLETVMEDFPDLETAKAYLQAHLPELEKIANDTLAAAGNSCQAVVTLAKEAFPTREYDTFTLPAGIYESLRVTIGSGEGKNWWCVVFPSLCASATTEGFEDTAVSAGFSDRVTGTLTGKQEYCVRFFLLDCFGWVENWIYGKGF